MKSFQKKNLEAHEWLLLSCALKKFIAETYTFSQVKELLQMHENALLNIFNKHYW